jgi:hypothetical protein
MGFKKVAMRVSPLYRPVSWVWEKLSCCKFESCPSSFGIDPEEGGPYGLKKSGDTGVANLQTCQSVAVEAQFL